LNVRAHQEGAFTFNSRKSQAKECLLCILFLFCNFGGGFENECATTWYGHIVESLQPSDNTNPLGKQGKSISDILQEGEGCQDFGKMFSTLQQESRRALFNPVSTSIVEEKRKDFANQKICDAEHKIKIVQHYHDHLNERFFNSPGEYVVKLKKSHPLKMGKRSPC
jgi:hypothetical protein